MIYWYSYSDQINIYWRYDSYIKDASYKFFLDDKFIGCSTKTHFEFKKLKPNTEYKISIYNGEQYFDEIVVSTKAKKKFVDVTKKPYFVKNNGELTTESLQYAINNIKSNEIIYLPAGTYFSGSLNIPNNKEIYLAKDACILGSSTPSDYLPKIPSRFEGTELECYSSLINIGKLDHLKKADNQNIIIRGEGSIIGGGNKLCQAIIDAESKAVDMSKEELSISLVAGRRRNRLIQINNSKNVIIDGITMGYSASWNLHMIYSSNIIVANCLFHSFGIHNGDGIDPDSSNNIDIYNVTFDVGDDCIAIKSGKNPEGNLINIPTHDINIFDCKTIKGHGCAIGSEISGGIYNVSIFDSDFMNTLYGLHIKTTKKRGGYVKNVNVINSSFSSINIRTVPYNDDGVSALSLTEFSNFNFELLTISGIMFEDYGKIDTCKHINVDGFVDNPKAFKDIKFDNILLLNTNNGINARMSNNNTENVQFSNLHYGGNTHEM